MKVFAMMALLLAAAYCQSNEIDVVLKMLGDLKNETSKQLQQLESDWETTRYQKQDIVNDLMRSASTQRGECNRRDQEWANKERDIRITLSYINWLEKRIKENNERLSRLDVNRCESNANFINDIKNSKKTLNLIAFLRRAVKNAKETDLPTLLQSAQFIQLKSFLAEDGEEPEVTSEDNEPPHVYDEPEAVDSTEDVSENQVDAAPDVETTEESATEAEAPTEEVEQQSLGDAHEEPDAPVPEHPLEAEEKATNEQLAKEAAAFNKIIEKGQKAPAEAGSGKDYSQFTVAQQELLNFLDILEDQVRGSFGKKQDDQVNSAMGYSDFKGLIQKENETFKGHLVAEDVNLEKLQNQLITILQATAACKDRLKKIQNSIDLANEDLASSEAHFKSVTETLQEEQNTFDDVYRIYSSQVGSQNTSYKRDVQAKITN
ncbi:unnamed protein product (macronuclear) [Paramecium tetraurelia]|uniref:Uncharacterized protein n=1 Tax=Paramecium tetraurelia TaxID=5888 RepID=A0CXM2_PARTE|nr:uncharacterized protein GSPATT00011171001 [Paramecium tetraurelia]CAK75539.1 unnamed protein product [Paramecium tetraurelia]|eukprot:XP_001442936.1 hypothetical protein (macronuclear) [Paramecium tetraurelia strain d4-2]